MTDKHGGFAFPQSHPDVAYSDYIGGGMTLRDWFAGQAMQAMLSNFDWMQHVAKQFENVSGDQLVPQMAYEFADAMLAARDLENTLKERNHE